MSWQLQEAKQKFSEVVSRALADGPQRITRHGREVVVMVGAEEYRRLVGEDGAGPDFKEFLASAPDLGRLEIRRDRRLTREVDLDPRTSESS